jgi:hypothetical protein
MKTLRAYALEASALEQQKQKQAEQKKRKRKAKKIEEEIDEMLPRESEELRFHRNLEDSGYGVMVTVKEEDGDLQFVRDDNDDLVIIGHCGGCNREAVSKPITRLEDLGMMIENFEVGSSHECRRAK